MGVWRCCPDMARGGGPRMPEQMNVEVAHRLSEQEKADRQKHRWEEVIEILEVVVLALAAIATPWRGSQAARGDGQQSVLYSDASVDRGRANTAATLGQQRLAADGAMFSAWLEARAAKDTQLQAILVRRFSPEYRAAFTAWLATAPLTHPAAGPGLPAGVPQPGEGAARDAQRARRGLGEGRDGGAPHRRGVRPRDRALR